MRAVLRAGRYLPFMVGRNEAEVVPASFDRARLPQDCDPDAVGRRIFANEILPRTSFRRGAKGEKVVG